MIYTGQTSSGRSLPFRTPSTKYAWTPTGSVVFSPLVASVPKKAWLKSLLLSARNLPPFLVKSWKRSSLDFPAFTFSSLQRNIRANKSSVDADAVVSAATAAAALGCVAGRAAEDFSPGFPLPFFGGLHCTTGPAAPPAIGDTVPRSAPCSRAGSRLMGMPYSCPVGRTCPSFCWATWVSSCSSVSSWPGPMKISLP